MMNNGDHFNNKDKNEKLPSGLSVIRPQLSNEVVNQKSKHKNENKSNAGIIRLNRDTMHQLLAKNDSIDNGSINDNHNEMKDLLYELRLNNDKHVNYYENHIKTLRKGIMNLCTNSLLNNLNDSNNLLQQTWHHCFYNYIHNHRQKSVINDQINSEDNSRISTLIDEGIEYFGGIYAQLTNKYQFNLITLLNRYKYCQIDKKFYKHLHDITSIVKILYIYLGDLWRYSDSIQTTSMVSRSDNCLNNSKSYYMKAHMLVPKNLHICSQLSLVSFYQKNLLDSIYYLIMSFEYTLIDDRCLNRFRTKSLQINSNRQNLLVYFDQIHVQHNKMMKFLQQDYDDKIKNDNIRLRRNKRGNRRINKNYRIEYWIRSDNTIAKCDMYNFYDLLVVQNQNDNDKNLLRFYENYILNDQSSNCNSSLLKSSQFKRLKHRFMISFLMIHSMLNYRNNLDNFYDVSNRMILEFQTLINNDDDSITTFFSLKLFIINIYSIVNTMNFKDEQQHSNNQCFYGFTLKNAYFIMTTMVSIILKRLIKLFVSFQMIHNNLLENKSSLLKLTNMNMEPKCIDDYFNCIDLNPLKLNIDKTNENEWNLFNKYLPCIKLWSDWCISFNPYFPPQQMNEIQTPGIDENVWQIFAKFLTQLHQIKKYPIEFKDNNTINTNTKYEYELLQLPEDKYLDGCRLLNDKRESSKYIQTPFIADIAYIYMRIENIKLFGHYLCDLKHPYLYFNTQISRFESLIDSDDFECQPGLKLKQLQQQQLLDIINSDTAYNPNDDNDEEEYYSNDEEAIEEMKNLNLNPIECRKLLEYRQFCKQNNHKNGKHFRKLFNQFEQTKRRFIIVPKYVIFDTNCLLNDMKTIMKFIANDNNSKSSLFTVVIPLIVIKELQSMVTRGQRINNDDDNDDALFLKYKQLAKKSTAIIEYLRAMFDNNQNEINVKTITSKGSLLNRLDYNEEFDVHSDAINNDDLILYGCANLIDKNLETENSNKNQLDNNKWMKKILSDAGEKCLSDQDEYIYRNVVLITDDLNLRIKSLGYDIPVKKFKQFKKWTKTLIN